MIPVVVSKCRSRELRVRAEALITNGAENIEINAAVRACMDFDKVVNDSDVKLERQRKFRTFLHKPNAASTYDLF